MSPRATHYKKNLFETWGGENGLLLKSVSMFQANAMATLGASLGEDEGSVQRNPAFSDTVLHSEIRVHLPKLSPPPAFFGTTGDGPQGLVPCRQVLS